MPLPAALAERLAKRGLVKSNIPTDSKKRTNEEVEEVIAENYDEPTKNNSSANSDTCESDDNILDKILEKISNCPNKFNQHHSCSEFCIQKFGYKKFEPHPIMEKRRIRMLKIYPLPANWIEVPDIHTNRYYYWNVETNQVCWISPSHPNAKLEIPKKKIDKDKVIEKPATISKSMNEKLDEFVDDLDNLVNSYQRNNSNKSKQSQQQYHKKSKQSNDIDPMDPSSYSDIPRGKWSAGLENNN